MNVEDIRTLFAYNQWANRRLLAAAQLLSPEDFLRDLRSSYGSVRGTLVHILGGEWVWLQLWLGKPSKEIVARSAEVWNPERFPDVAALESSCDALQHDQNAFIHTLTDELVTARISFASFQGNQLEFSRAHMMQHVVNHSSYHRGQVTTLLRQLSQTPPGTDLVIFLNEAGQ